MGQWHFPEHGTVGAHLEVLQISPVYNIEVFWEDSYKDITAAQF